MFTYRLRGLLHLHAFATTVLAVLFFWGFDALAVHSPWISLSLYVNRRLSTIAIVAGMLVSVRFLNAIAPRFHAIGWPTAAQFASRQVVLVASLLFTLIVATKDRTISRVFLALYLVLLWVLLVVTNRLLPRYLANLAFGNLNRLPTLFVGSHSSFQLIDAWLAQKRHLGVSAIGFLSDDDHRGARNHALGPYLGKNADLGKVIGERGASQVVLLDVPVNKDETRRIIETCQSEGCRLLIHDNVADRLPIPMIGVIEDGHYFFTNRDEPLEDPANRFMKRLFDVAVSLPTVVLILPPLCIVVWVAQQLQAPGPLLFVRPRGGRARSEFKMLKFRSMYHVSAADRDREAKQAREGDARIYPFGAFLRRTSLDEFPQFWNVLMGDMSIVGPRPHLPKHDHEFSKIAKTYRTRHLVKPGITGLAQIRGFRGEITDPDVLEKRVEQDIIYITEWSIWLDVQVTVKTIIQVFFPPRTAR